MIGQIIFDSGGLGANRNVSGKLGIKWLLLFYHIDERSVDPL